MADGNSHPFNSDVIASETLIQYHKQSSSHHNTLNTSKNHQQKFLLDLLSANHTSNHFFNSNDPSLNIASPTISDDDFNRLKTLIRTNIWPIEHPIRRQLWMNILTFNRVSTSKSSKHSTTLTPVSPTSLTLDHQFHNLPLKTSQWPNFVDTTNLCFYHLNESIGRSNLQRILFTFALHHPDLTYCPALEPFSALLLHYFNENEVLFLINRLLQKHWLCGETRLQWEANWNVFRKLFKTFFKSNADAIDLRHSNNKGFYQEWFWWIFRDLPFPYLVKIMDCFFLEGPKILYRIGLALLHLYMKTVKDQSNDENSRTIGEFCQQIPVTIEHLLRVAFQIRNLKRRTIEQLVNHEEKLLHDTRRQNRIDEHELINSNNNNNNNNSILTNNSRNSNQQTNSIDHQSSFVTHQHLTRIPSTSILDHQQFLTLWNWLPARLSLSQPNLIFTTEQHGFRLQTLLEKLDEVEYSILIVRATNGEIFGAFCAGAWADRHQKTYFGFGESFLFTLVPKQIKYSWVGLNQSVRQQSLTDSIEQRQTQVKRELFLFVNQEKVIIGGGNGDGLCIDASLCEGRTAHCETFNNQPLCSSPDFSISVLEMITFDFSSS